MLDFIYMRARGRTFSLWASFLAHVAKLGQQGLDDQAVFDAAASYLHRELLNQQDLSRLVTFHELSAAAFFLRVRLVHSFDAPQPSDEPVWPGQRDYVPVPC